MKLLTFSSVGLIGVAVLAGCAADPVQTASRNPYDAALYTGARQLYQVDKVADLRAPRQWTVNGAPLEAVSYAGIDGAREAHLAYADEIAEKLDGRCERYVKVSADETLADIASLCDVPAATLASANPSASGPAYLTKGQVLEVPGGIEAKRASAFDMGAVLTGLYTVKDGDSLENIAYRFNVSSDAVAILNPMVDWTSLTSGQKVLAPVAVVAGQQRPAGANIGAVSYAPAGEWQGYAGAGLGDSDAARYGASGLAPYQLGPVQTALPGGAGEIAPKLVVDNRFVEAGKPVNVTVTGLPAGTPVTLYRGDNLQEMRAVGQMRTGPDGAATERVRTSRKKSNMGGVVFKATRDDTGETLYSERVGVFKLGDNANAGHRSGHGHGDDEGESEE
ncbi:MAG: LysM peptidoglycan-binding domain-containing protein [Parvularculaceae bacterium]|nr:LysM peptidoglycan-binding domain-containing protein [Parvularculaceae bacterium]